MNKIFNVIINNAGAFNTQSKEDYYILTAIVTTDFNDVLENVMKINSILRKKNNIPRDGEINAKKIDLEDRKRLFTAVQYSNETVIVSLIAKLGDLNVNNRNSKVYYYHIIEQMLEYLLEKDIVQNASDNKLRVKLDKASISIENRNSLLYYLKTQLNLQKGYDIKIETVYCDSKREVLIQTANTFSQALHIPAATKYRNEIYSKYNKGGKLKIYNYHPEN